MTETIQSPKALEKLLKDAGLSFKTGSNSFVFTCPKCHKKDKLYVRRKDGRFKCFFCANLNNFQGKPEFALRALTHLSLDEIRSKLYGGISLATFAADFAFDDIFLDEDDEEEIELLPSVTYPYGYKPITSPSCSRGLKYMLGRGITQRQLIKYGIYYSQLERRVIFPIATNGILNGWQARYIEDTTYISNGEIKNVPKITTSPNTPRDRLLMFHDGLYDSPHIVLCEGPVDALKCDLIGGNVATMGKIITHKQLQVVKSHTNIRKIYLALDPDAFEEILKLIHEFDESYTVYWLQAPKPYKDLGEMSCEDVKELFLSTKPIQKGPLVFDFGLTF
jgi:hypothetical protein